jgi:dihydrolipoamide dehydrogenase
MRSFDVVVLGAGPAGEVAAGRLAGHGLSVAIVEDRLVGGECSFWACMPSKALLRPYEALAEARRIPGAAEALTGELDVPAVLARRDEVIHDLDDSSQLPWLEDRGIELVRGFGQLAG